MEENIICPVCKNETCNIEKCYHRDNSICKIVCGYCKGTGYISWIDELFINQKESIFVNKVSNVNMEICKMRRLYEQNTLKVIGMSSYKKYVKDGDKNG